MNDFDLIRKWYSAHMPEIMKAGKRGWAYGDPYGWDARGLSVTMTPIESAIWNDIRQAGIVMYPQVPVGRFFVDFGNPVAKVAIECDGRMWHLDKEKDKRRDEFMRSIGWAIYRVAGSACMKDFDEETMQSSDARKLVDRIGSSHGICEI